MMLKIIMMVVAIGVFIWMMVKNPAIWAKVKSIFSKIIKIAWNFLKKLPGMIWNAVKFIAPYLWTGIKQLGKWLWSGLKWAGSMLWTGIKYPFVKLGEYLGEVFPNIKKTICGALSKIPIIGKLFGGDEKEEKIESQKPAPPAQPPPPPPKKEVTPMVRQYDYNQYQNQKPSPPATVQTKEQPVVQQKPVVKKTPVQEYRHYDRTTEARTIQTAPVQRNVDIPRAHIPETPYMQIVDAIRSSGMLVKNELVVGNTLLRKISPSQSRRRVKHRICKEYNIFNFNRLFKI